MIFILPKVFCVMTIDVYISRNAALYHIGSAYIIILTLLSVELLSTIKLNYIFNQFNRGLKKHGDWRN